MADPGFPIGGGGGADLQRIHFLAKMYAKMKEMDPVGGAGHAPAVPPLPGSANVNDIDPFVHRIHCLILKDIIILYFVHDGEIPFNYIYTFLCHCNR